MYDYGFRDYKPMLGRWTTLDPIRDSHNWYVYCNNDPVNFIDPLGLLPETSGTGVAPEPTPEELRIQHLTGWALITGGVGAVVSGSAQAIGETLLTGEVSVWSALQIVGGIKAIGIGAAMVQSANKGQTLDINLGPLTP